MGEGEGKDQIVYSSGVVVLRPVLSVKFLLLSQFLRTHPILDAVNSHSSPRLPYLKNGTCVYMFFELF